MAKRKAAKHRSPAGIPAMVRRLPSGKVQVKIPLKRNPGPQERYFKRKDAAERFKRLMQARGLYASVYEEPVDPHARTRRERGQRLYRVVYGDPFR